MKNVLLKGLLVSTLVSSTLLSSVYVGVEYGIISGTSTVEYTGDHAREYESDYDAKNLKIIIGTGEDGGLKGQLYYAMVSDDEGTSEDLTEFGLDVIKEFEMSKNLYPFIKLGLGYGTIEYEEESHTSTEISFNIGAGVSFKVVDHLYLIGGLDYTVRMWEDFEVYTTTVSETSNEVKPYVGINYQF